MSFLLLAGAILFEVSGTLALRMAAHHGRRWIPPVVVAYLLAFALLSLTLQSGMTVGVAYGIWTAVGVALTAIAGRILFKEPFTWLMGLGVALIIGGVLLVELGAEH
ncbi:multidrug efflux SMR transporter [Schumannella sp. 10F1B-5-1]|uniref:DMT family transporter n=1 Tax=Schumannella sp. 10F1B-5-1 TaxID=2590780 RepID=UPI0011302A34|nr:SMR family transporter [Schumannella sp. 10F1B-5-1]TPW71672.1 QacE family quaternary ammonium compound efflux SMR transporter [Schumannella sp. 10F1B-5-1]